jgi:hypothetical protein
MSASRFSIGRISIGLLCGASLFAMACNKGGSASKEDLALVPKDAEIVVGLNIARMRGTAMWKKGFDFLMAEEKAKKELADLNKACPDFNSGEGFESIFVALPDPTGPAKEGAAIIRLKNATDETKVKACLDYLAGKNSEKVTPVDYNGKKIYTSAKEGDAGDKSGFVLLDNKTLGFGSGMWVKKIVDLAGGKDQASAKTNEKLVAIVKRAKVTDAIWGAGTVPASARDSFKAQPQLAPLASLKSVFGSVDFATGLAVDLNMETGSDADAKAINEQVTTQMAEAKKSPQVMMLGVGAWLDGVKNEAKGPVFHVAMNFNQQQVDEMIARVQGLLKSFGAGLAGPPGMGAPHGMPPGGAEPPSVPQAP